MPRAAIRRFAVEEMDRLVPRIEAEPGMLNGVVWEEEPTHRRPRARRRP